MEKKIEEKNKIKVLIVDDSALVRQTLSEILSSDQEIEVIGTAADPYFAVQKIAHIVPDVIILDIEMPRMDGLTFLEKIMNQHPLPVVICSSLVDDSSCETAIKAFDLGAIEVISKPKLGTKTFFEESKVRICDIVKAASKVKPNRIPKVAPKLSADVIIEKPFITTAMDKTTEKIVVVGASTGGTEAIYNFLSEMPLDCPAIAIVQHMPEKFTTSFANRLNALCKITVKEAANGDPLLRGHALIAPGNKHMLVKRSGARYYVEIKDGPLVSRHRPSVDVLFRSAARYAGKNAVGVILTGMGDDGALGMLEMKEAGAYTIAQDENSCVVFGMPKSAIERGAVLQVLPLKEIPNAVIRICSSK